MFSEKGFAFCRVVIGTVFVATLVVGSAGYIIFQNRKEMRETNEATPKNNEMKIEKSSAEPKKDNEKQEKKEKPVKEPVEKLADQLTALPAGSILQPSISQLSLKEQFLVIEQELISAKKTGSLLGTEHRNRIEEDIMRLENQGYNQNELNQLRQLVFELSPDLQDKAKQNYVAQPKQPNCKSNPSPIFSNHITDMDKARYIVPPPTMGSGPSLKTHSYIGTEHARVPIYAPTNLALKSGSHNIDGPYMIELQASCEVTVRFGHITEPVEAIKQLLPSEPKLNSITQELSPIEFLAGEILGYTTGTNAAGNWDFGVYNNTVRNRYVDDPNWNQSAVYTTAVCPFDYFTEQLKPAYFSKFNSEALGGNPPHGKSFCQ